MFTCAQCAIEACRSGKLDQMPKNCPMHDPAFFEQVLEEYFKPENHDFFVAKWPRLREVMEFARRMGYTKLGLAFCAGLHKEAAVVDRIFRKNGFEVVSVICKTGSIPKDKAGVPQQFRVRPGTYEVMCNPIAQAELLNREGEPGGDPVQRVPGTVRGPRLPVLQILQGPGHHPGSQGPGHRQQPRGGHLLRRRIFEKPAGAGEVTITPIRRWRMGVIVLIRIIRTRRPPGGSEKFLPGCPGTSGTGTGQSWGRPRFLWRSAPRP